MNNYQKMLLSFFFSEFSFMMYFVTITWIVYEQSNNALLTGMLVSMGFLPGLLLNLFFGVFVDRYNRKLLAVVSHAVSIFSITLLVVNDMLTNLSIPLLIAAHMFIQVAGSLLRPAIQALLAEIFEEKELPNVFSKTASVTIFGGIVGASLGGILLAQLGSVFTLAIATLAYIIALTFLLLIPYEKPHSNTEFEDTPSILTELKSGFQYLIKNKFLLLLFVMMFNG
jgi:MFS transporter, DHA3 family, macrolide efflux protein